MFKLNYQTLKLKGQVLTSIHIWSGESYDRLDYFVDERNFYLVDRRWLNWLIDNWFWDIVDGIAKALRNWDFINLEKLKSKVFEKVIDKFLIEKYQLQIKPGNI